jgi:rhamnosyltransferase
MLTRACSFLVVPVFQANADCGRRSDVAARICTEALSQNTASKGKMIRPKVLVLMAAYNGSKWIVEQIETILGQVSVDVDLLISDDGSTDGTLDQLERYANDPRVRTLSPASPSGSAAQNFLWLIRNTSAENYAFVALSDQDDIWHENKLFRACSALNHRNAAGYSCAVTAFWADGREATLRQADRVTKSDFMLEGIGQGCTFVVARDHYRRLRAFFCQNSTEAAHLHYHDWAIYAISRSWKVRWIFDQEPMMNYRQHSRNDTGARVTFRGIIMRLRLIKDGWYTRQLREIAQLCSAADPSDATIAEWNAILGLPPGLIRRYRIAVFCLMGGRRRRIDNLVLLFAAMVGWI